MTSRRQNAGPDKSAQNQQVIKSLLKLPGNKHCADCKRNAHPRWASWNLGIFICIRCSGIHRGMGTHISRVKSVDLDSWTDEQLQSMLRWGNSRANKYWEAKLASGHSPSESKIENFIRTKYDSKRWVMEGPMPDPSTLEDSDADDTPLRVVQEKQKAEAAASPTSAIAAPNILDDRETKVTPNIGAPPISQSQAKAPQAPPKQTKPADSLLGLDFFGPSPSQSPRPSSDFSAPSNTVQAGGSSRPDLNRSILSLYSSAPKQQQPLQQQQQSQQQARMQGGHQHTNSGSFGQFGGMQQPIAQPSSSGIGGLNDAFGGLSFSTAASPPPPQQPAKPSPFANLTAGLKTSSSNNQYKSSSSNTSFSQPQNSSSGLTDIWGMATPTQNNTQSTSNFGQSSAQNSLFNDNAWASPQQTPQASNNASSLNWASPMNTTKPAQSKPVIAADDDFGAFSSGGTLAPKPVSKPGNGKPVTFDEDLFQNVWN